LYRSGHIQSLSIRASATPHEIDNAVKEAFTGVDAVSESLNMMDDWRLLFKVAQGRGNLPCLIPHKDARQVMVKDLEWYVYLIHSRMQ